MIDGCLNWTKIEDDVNDWRPRWRRINQQQRHLSPSDNTLANNRPDIIAFDVNRLDSHSNQRMKMPWISKAFNAINWNKFRQINRRNIRRRSQIANFVRKRLRFDERGQSNFCVEYNEWMGREWEWDESHRRWKKTWTGLMRLPLCQNVMCAFVFAISFQQKTHVTSVISPSQSHEQLFGVMIFLFGNWKCLPGAEGIRQLHLMPNEAFNNNSLRKTCNFC